MPDEFGRDVTLAPPSPVATAGTQTGVGAGVPVADILSDRAEATVPDFPHPAYRRMQPRWELCRALMAGTEAIREGGERYLPRLAAEGDDAYLFRKTLVAVAPMLARTVKATVGLINQSPPEFGDDMPKEIVDLAENIDRAGTALQVFCKQLTLDGVVDGYAGILVDYPKVANPNGTSADDEKRLGLRPYFILVRVDDVIKPVYAIVSGVRTLILLVIRETTEAMLGDFGLTTVTRFRVYRRSETGQITYELWERAFGEAVSHRTQEPTPMLKVTAIPWAPFAPGEPVAGPQSAEVRPPLLDLAYLNLEHHQVKTNLRNLETLAMVPTLVRIGATPDGDGKYPAVTMGPRSTIEAPMIDGVSTPVYWLSPDVTVLEPGNATLQDLKADMGSAGLAFLAPDTRVAETAAAKRIDATAQNATITTVAGKLEDCLETAFGFMAQYLGVKVGSVTVNTDFENTVMAAPMVAALGALAANGKLDIETLLDLLEEGHILPAGTDKGAIVKRILTENVLPPAPDPSAAPVDPNANQNANPNAGDQNAGDQNATDQAA